eukprot:scaffold122437_cov21-Tisochrysis_lutea.AAC.1
MFGILRVYKGACRTHEQLKDTVGRGAGCRDDQQTWTVHQSLLLVGQYIAALSNCKPHNAKPVKQ